MKPEDDLEKPSDLDLLLRDAVESLWLILQERKCLDPGDAWEINQMVRAALGTPPAKLNEKGQVGD